MKQALLLIGGGGHCRSCIDVIESNPLYAVAGIVDSSAAVSTKILGYRVVGSDESLSELLQDNPNALITVGQMKSYQTRVRLYDLLKSLNAVLPSVYSSSSIVSRHAMIADGVLIMHNAIVNAGAKLGNNCIVNSQALVEHDVEVAEHCHISTGVKINGGVTVGKCTFIGSGAIIREGIKIGERVVIGAGVTVLKDIPSDTLVRH
jgi:sugar O-acyltransferase (sialic acid O-acetyltransferase NeuD family)